MIADININQDQIHSQPPYEYVCQAETTPLESFGSIISVADSAQGSISLCSQGSVSSEPASIESEETNLLLAQFAQLCLEQAENTENLEDTFEQAMIEALKEVEQELGLHEKEALLHQQK